MANAETSLAGSFRIRLPTPNIVDLTADSDDEVQNSGSSSQATSSNHIGSSLMVRTTNGQPSHMHPRAAPRRSPHGVHPNEPIEVPSDDEDILYMGARQRRMPFASNIILPGTRDDSPGLIEISRRPHVPGRVASGEHSRSCLTSFYVHNPKLNFRWSSSFNATTESP